MKYKLLTTLALVVMVLSLQAVDATAQTGRKGKANIPFNFVISGRVLPAGSYYLTQNGPHVIGLVGNTDSAATIVLHNDDEARVKTPSLVFLRIGQKYFLTGVWLDRTVGIKVPESAEQREALRALNQEAGKAVVALR